MQNAGKQSCRQTGSVLGQVGAPGSEGGRLGRLGLKWLTVSELAESEERAGDEPGDHSGNRHRQ